MPTRSLITSLFMRLMSVARYRFIIELTLLFIVVWCGCALLVYYFEVGLNSRIHTPLQTIYALLVTMMTSGDSAVVPQTAGGRMVMSFALILSKLLTALLCALAAAILIERRLKEEMGLKMHELEQHILLIGWNMKGPQVLSMLRNDPQFHSTPIVLMADVEQKPVDDPLLRFTRATYPIRSDAMQRASLSYASLAVVLANYSERQNADALTAINCLMVRQANPDARIIAELLDPSQRAYLEAAGANAIVSIGEVGGFLLAEAVLGHKEASQLLQYIAENSKKIPQLAK